VPFDPRYTQVGFNIASVQVRKGHHSSSSAENKPITNLAIDVLLGCSVNVLQMKTEVELFNSFLWWCFYFREIL